MRFPMIATMLGIACSAAACDRAPRLHVERGTVATGEDVVVVFDDPLTGRADNQYWVALQPAGRPPSDTSTRTVLDRETRRVRLHTSTPGDFEVRLHEAFPRRDHQLVASVPVVVVGWPVKAGTTPLPLPERR